MNGELFDAGAGRLSVEDPGTGAALAKITLADAADMDAAVAAALRCHASEVLTPMRPVEPGRLVAAIGR